MTDQSQRDSDGRVGPLRSTQDFAGGLFLLFIACFALYHGWKLPMGTLRSMGPGMLPISLAVMVGAGGLILIAFSIVGKTGEHMTAWSWRGMFFIVLSVVVFALTIQRFGLIVAGPLSMIVAMMASPDIKWGEGIIFCVGMTAFCALLFKTALGLPIPVNNLW